MKRRGDRSRLADGAAALPLNGYDPVSNYRVVRDQGRLPFPVKDAISVSMRTLIKHVLASSEPSEGIEIRGWVRTRRDAKGFSFLELNDGSCLANLQVVVDAGTPGCGTSAAASPPAPRRSSRASWCRRRRRARNGNCAPRGWSWSARPMRRYPLQKKGPHAGVPAHASRTCARARICSARCSACAAGWPSRCTSSSRSATSFMSTRRSSPPATAKGAGEMFRVTTAQGKHRREAAGGFLRQADLPDRQRPARRRDLRLRAVQHLHLRPDLPRRELEHRAPRRRVLDDRAGDGVLRFAGRHGPGGGVHQGHGAVRAGALRRGPRRSSPSSWTRDCTSG